MKTFTEALRYEYDLTPDSYVIDAGGYEGNWAAEINRKYGCRVHIFEPVTRFRHAIVERFKGNPMIGVDSAGFGGKQHGGGTPTVFHIQNDSTGAYAGSPDTEEVDLYSATYIIGGLDRMIDLLKLNIEGMEFEVLWDLLDSGKIKKIRNLQVQFHPVIAQAGDHRESIRKRLAETHEEMFCEPFCWEGWRLK
jgi:FkbM family methyltransferase